MNLQLEDKTALVSGSSQGIGFAIAEALAKEGATVVINSNKQEHVDKAIGKLSKTAPGAHLIGAVADLSSLQGVQDLLQKVPAVDILVNSVGFYVAKDFLEISDEDWDQMMNLNFMSGVRLSRAIPCRHENARLGPHYFHFKRIRRQNPSRDDSLRCFKGRTDRRCQRHRGDYYRDRCYGK